MICDTTHIYIDDNLPTDSSDDEVELFKEEEEQPAQQEPLSIILDLENTLIHATESKIQICDFIISNKCKKIYVQKRPNLDGFLNYLSNFAIIYLYSAMDKEEVNQTLQYIDPFNEIFSHVFHKSDPLFNNNIVEIMKHLGTYPERTIVVNDIAYFSKAYPSNGIKIGSYKGNSSDAKLVQLIEVILQLVDTKDIRGEFIF